MKDKWIIRPPADGAAVKKLQEDLKSTPLYAELLVQRGITSLTEYEAEIELKDFAPADPFLIKDMQLCCQRINQAVENGEKILIYGDYDADGLTSTALMYETLMNIGADVSYYVPDRLVDGYGPNVESYERVIEPDVSLLLTVDNGVTGTDAFDWTKEHGIEVIVCDHHELPENLSPNIFGLIHPAAPSSQYPNRKLAGVGVAYRLACALLDGEQEELLDLVAIGTISDVVELTPENRYFVKMGLDILKNRERMGLDEILKQAKIESSTITDETIGYQIAPRLNSAGRMGEAGFVVDLLTTFEEDVAVDAAKKLESLNEERKKLTQEMVQEALEQVKGSDDQVVIAVSSRWSEGIIGIIAAKLAEQMHRPAIVFHLDENSGIAKGSARTKGEVNIFEMIAPHRDLLLSFGGHRGAAGLSIEANNLPEFQQKIQQVNLPVEELESKLMIDHVANLSDLSMDFFQELEHLRPFGPGNDQPTFLLENFTIQNVHQIGANGAHIRMAVKQGKNQLNAIGFQIGQSSSYFVNNNVEQLAFRLSLNNWNSLVQLQLRLLDFKVSKPVIFDERMRKIKGNDLVKRSWPLVFFSKQHAINFQKNYSAPEDQIYLANKHNLTVKKQF